PSACTQLRKLSRVKFPPPPVALSGCSVRPVAELIEPQARHYTVRSNFLSALDAFRPPFTMRGMNPQSIRPEVGNPSFRQFMSAVLIVLLSGLCVGAARAQADNNPLPHLVTKDGRHALIV